MYPGIYPILPVRFCPDTYPTRGLHGYYPDMYPPNTAENLLATTRYLLCLRDWGQLQECIDSDDEHADDEHADEG